ncbi:MAG TPA: hypothetical protein VJ463_04665 [Geothrix sp.]|nr:hypothetical protein [Geothrix sp.]
MITLTGRSLRRSLVAFGLLGLLSAPLFGQLDPRLQKGKTDFLDLYQKTSTELKPEIVTVFDFSGSMNRLMFHPLFPNNWADEDATSTSTSMYTNVCVVINTAGTAVSSIRFGTTAGSTSVSVSGKTYTIGGAPKTTAGVRTNILVKPDGTEVTSADVDAALGVDAMAANAFSSADLRWNTALSARSKDARNWVRAASHVRLECVYGGITRNIDFPLNWAVLPTAGWRTSTGAVVGDTLADGSSPYMIDSTLPRETVLDPKTSIRYDLDSNYLGTQSNDVMLRRVSNDQTANIGNNSASNVGLYRTRYIEWLFWGQDGAGHYCIPDAISTSISAIDPTSLNSGAFTFTTSPKKAFANGIPNRNRVQAIKEAAIKTWLKYQDKVYWAFRSLAATGATINQTTSAPVSITVPGVDDNSQSGNQTWNLFNGDTDNGVRRISKLIPSGATPLTQSHASVYGQLQNVDPFSRVQKAPNDAPQDCMKHFMILFTDGAPNESPLPSEGSVANFPYLGGAAAGNLALKGNAASLNSGGTYFNSPTLSGVAAHGGNLNIGAMVDPLTVSYPASGSIGSFAPFWIKRRGVSPDAMTFTYPHPIQTMTVGVSLGVNWASAPPQPIPLTSLPKSLNTDISSAKYRLLATAAFGDPRKTSYNMATVKPYTVSSSGTTDPDSVYFFDATTPETLVNNLDRAFNEAVAISNQNATATPTVPFVGLGLSSQIYLGNFTPPKDGGPIWPGDLLMFPTRQVNGQTVILDKTGGTATVLDATSAMWSASKALANNRKWDQRKVWTRLPATASVPNPPLVPFAFKPTTGSTANFDAIKAYVATALTTEDAKSNLIKFILGADLATAGNPNRTTIMGDVINSAPATVEYTLTPAIKTALPPVLSAEANRSGARFRVVFVGTNQGTYHAFGEISWVDLTDPTKPLTFGVVDELWAFVPTDFLANLDYMQTVNTHRFLADGSPYIYHLDLAAGTAIAGNGTVDSSEVARVIFGLRKGGRSYYALNISDPFAPSIAWAISADEASTIPNAKIEYSNPALARTVVKNMGFSTSTLAIGRVAYGSPSVTLRDALFLGGGLSTTEVDEQFAPAKLGRSALAVDVNTGNILMAWDFTTIPVMGPVSSGLVPFEYFLNSGLVQRAYFTDFNGDLWALGSGKTSAASDGKEYRRDTSNLDAWTIDGNVGTPASVRKIYAGGLNEYISTLPAPFLTGNVPTTAGAIPVGIAVVSGDRNNPLDRNYTALTIPTQHRVTVVFDNQEAILGGTAINQTDLYDVPDSASGVTPSEVVPGSPSFYLANGKRGYDILFPAKSGSFIPKGVNEPLVLGGALFFAYFKPELSDPCSGGSGTTNSNRVCDVLYPVYQGNNAVVTNTYGSPCQSGKVFAWSGVATNFSARSTVSVNQGGVVSIGGGTTPGSNQMQIQTIFGQIKDRLPRPRTWRTVR